MFLIIIFLIIKTLMKKYNHWIIKQAEIAIEKEHEIIEGREHEHHEHGHKHEDGDSSKHKI